MDIKQQSLLLDKRGQAEKEPHQETKNVEIQAVLLYSTILDENVVLGLDMSAREAINGWARTFYAVVYWPHEIKMLDKMTKNDKKMIHLWKSKFSGEILPKNESFDRVLRKIEPKTGTMF